MVVTWIWQSLYWGFYLYKLALLKIKICQKSQTCLNITQIFIQVIVISSQVLRHFPLLVSLSTKSIQTVSASDLGIVLTAT